MLRTSQQCHRSERNVEFWLFDFVFRYPAGAQDDPSCGCCTAAELCSALSIQAEARGLLQVRNVTSQRATPLLHNLPSLTQPSQIETSFLSAWHSAQICILSAGVTWAKTGCKTNTSFWENDYRLKNIPSAGCVLWPLSQNDPVPECINTSMWTLWSKIKRVCSLTYMIVCNIWTCKTCAYTPQSSQASFLIFETKYKQRIKLKVKEKWNTELKCWPLSQEPVSVCLPSSPSKVALFFFFFFLHPDSLLPNTNITPVQRENGVKNITNLTWGDSEERYTIHRSAKTDRLSPSRIIKKWMLLEVEQ